MEDPKKKMALKEFVAKMCDDLNITGSCEKVDIEAIVTLCKDSLVISENGIGQKITISIVPRTIDFETPN